MLREDDFVTGEYYHLYNRGVDKRSIFKSRFDYERFVMLLKVANSTESFRLDQLINYQHLSLQEIMSLDIGKKLVSVGAWCLMTNHFHILVRERTEGGISQFMKKLGTGYSMYFNIKYQRTGSLFGGPFRSQHISEDPHLRHMFGYIHLNPLDIRFSNWENNVGKKSPEGWKRFLDSYNYSSYKDYMDVERSEGKILNEKAFPGYFSEKKSFEDFINDYLSLK